MAGNKRSGRKKNLDSSVLDAMEGLLSETNSGRKPVDPLTWVMNRCDVSSTTVRRWAAGKNSNSYQPTQSREREKLADFARLYEQLQALAAVAPLEVITNLVDSPDTPAPTRLKGATWLLEKIWPERYAATTTQVDVNVSTGPGDLSVSDYSDDLIEAITDEDIAQLEEIEAAIAELKERAKSVIAAARSRTAAP